MNKNTESITFFLCIILIASLNENYHNNLENLNILQFKEICEVDKKLAKPKRN
jgi:hypothetical protein